MNTTYHKSEGPLRVVRRSLPEMHAIDNRLRYIAQSQLSGPLQGVAQLPPERRRPLVLEPPPSKCIPQATLMDRAAACIRSLLAPSSK